VSGKWNLIAGVTLLAGIAPWSSCEAITFPRDTPVAEFCAAIESNLVNHQFDALDRLEQELRDPDIRLIGGNSQLYEFYGVLGAFVASPVYSCSSRLPLERKQEFLEQWLTAKPASIAAHVALAQFWSDAGWKERGNDFANTVGFFQWITLYSDLSKAKSILTQVDTRTDPHGYYLLLEIAQSEAAWFTDRRATLDDLYGQAIHAYPEYYHFYSQRAEDLQIRWHGEPGELSAYLASLASQPGGDAGLVAYSFIAYKLMQETERSILLRTTGLSWPLIQSGYSARERLYGMRNRDWNALFNLALAGVDPEAANKALAHVGENWDPVVWKEKSYFDDAVDWTHRARP
jgi:hypothetical protein